MTFVHPSSIVAPAPSASDSINKQRHSIPEQRTLTATNAPSNRGNPSYSHLVGQVQESITVDIDPALKGFGGYGYGVDSGSNVMNPIGMGNGVGFGEKQVYASGAGMEEKYARDGIGRESIDYSSLPQSSSGSFSSHGGSFSSLVAGGTIYSPATNGASVAGTVGGNGTSYVDQMPAAGMDHGNATVDLGQTVAYPPSANSFDGRPGSGHGLPSPMSAIYNPSSFVAQQQQFLQAQRYARAGGSAGAGKGHCMGSGTGLGGEDMPSNLPPISQDFARPSETRRPATSAGIMQSARPTSSNGRFPVGMGGAGASSVSGVTGRVLTPQETADWRRVSVQGPGSSHGPRTGSSGLAMVRECSGEVNNGPARSVRPTDLRLDSPGRGAAGGIVHAPGGQAGPDGRRESDYSDLFAHSIHQVSAGPPSSVPYQLGGSLERDLRRASETVGGSQGQTYALRPGSNGNVMSTMTGGAPRSAQGVRFQTSASDHSYRPVSPTSTADNGALSSLVTAAGMMGGPSSADLLALRRASEPHFKHPFNQVNLPSQARMYQSFDTYDQAGASPGARQFSGFQMNQAEPVSAGSNYGGGFPGDRRGSVISYNGMRPTTSSTEGGSRRPSVAGSGPIIYPASAGPQYASFPPEYRFGNNSPRSADYAGPGPAPGQTLDYGPPMNWPPAGPSSYYPSNQYPPRNDSLGYDSASYGAHQRGSGSTMDHRSSLGQHSQYADARRESNASLLAEDEDMREGVLDPASGQVHKKRPRRKFEEIERLYLCGFEGCEKSYGTLNHLNAHVYMQKHGIKRRPEEFKEIRRAWKKQKKESAARGPRNNSLPIQGSGPDSMDQAACYRPPEENHRMTHRQHVVGHGNAYGGEHGEAHWGQGGQHW